MSAVPEIEPRSAHDRADDVVLLDVREPDEFAAGHAPGAVHLPLGRIGEAVGMIEPGRAVVAICRSGGRSARATEVLRAEGLDVHNLAGGMQAWDGAGLPVVRDDGSAGEVI